MQSPSIGARIEPEWAGIECDIMECFSVGKGSTGNIMNGYGKQYTSDGRVKYDIEETADGWHTFAMDWREDGYTFYCDGKEISRCNKHVSHVPEFLLLTTEVQGYRSVKQGKFQLLNGGVQEDPPYVIKGEFEDDAFICDYVRVFDRV